MRQKLDENIMLGEYTLDWSQSEICNFLLINKGEFMCVIAAEVVHLVTIVTGRSE